MNVGVKMDNLAGVLLGWIFPVCGPSAQPGSHQLLLNQQGKGVSMIQLGRCKWRRREEDLNTSKAWAGFWGGVDTGARVAIHSFGMDHFPVSVSLCTFSLYLACSCQEVILQRCHLPLVLCNISPSAPTFHCVGTLTALNISSSMPGAPSWRKGL